MNVFNNENTGGIKMSEVYQVPTNTKETSKETIYYIDLKCSKLSMDFGFNLTIDDGLGNIKNYRLLIDEIDKLMSSADIGSDGRPLAVPFKLTEYANGFGAIYEKFQNGLDCTESQRDILTAIAKIFHSQVENHKNWEKLQDNKLTKTIHVLLISHAIDKLAGKSEFPIGLYEHDYNYETWSKNVIEPVYALGQKIEVKERFRKKDEIINCYSEFYLTQLQKFKPKNYDTAKNSTKSMNVFNK